MSSIIFLFLKNFKKEIWTAFQPSKRQLQQPDTGLFAGSNGIVIPDAGLDFADMGAAHHQHTQTGLTDTATHGQGQLAVQQCLVEGELSAVIFAG